MKGSYVALEGEGDQGSNVPSELNYRSFVEIRSEKNWAETEKHGGNGLQRGVGTFPEADHHTKKDSLTQHWE